jgi:hypothetical protein
MRVAIVTVLALLLVGCNTPKAFIRYDMPNPPAELMTPPSKLKEIHPYHNELGVVPQKIK